MKIVLYIVFFFGIITTALAESLDTIAVVKLTNLNKPNRESLEFDIILSKSSQKWYYFANSTFHVVFPEQYNINLNDIDIILQKTDLPISAQTGYEYPSSGYFIQPFTINNMLSISFLGPNTYNKSQYFAVDTSKLLGRFRITSKIGQFIPEMLEWKTPTRYFQAIAYKTEIDSVILENIIWYHSDDNIEMQDGVRNIVVFENPTKPSYETVLKDFIVQYDRVRNTKFQWIMKSEYNVYGYTVAKALKVDLTIDETSLNYDTVASCMPGSSYFNPAFISQGNAQNIDHIYGIFNDSVRYRSVQYCYNLYAHFIDEMGNITPPVLLATRCPYIPNAVIVEAEMVDPKNYPAAIAAPTLRYKLDDDCYVTGYIIDAVGKTVEILTVGQNQEIMKNLRMVRGEYVSSYTPPPWVANGYYQFIIQAIPIDDNSVEISSTIVPFYLIRNGGN